MEMKFYRAALLAVTIFLSGAMKPETCSDHNASHRSGR
jgi:hypothetical protein